MKTNLLLIALITFSLFSCKVIKVADLKLDNTSDSTTISLKTVIDEESISEYYISDIHVIKGTKKGDRRSIHYKDRRATDTEAIINSFSDGDKGSLEFSIINFESAGRWYIKAPSHLFMNIPNALGAPYNIIVTEVEFEVIVKDNSGNVLKKLNVYGKGKAFVAAYWGYSASDKESKFDSSAQRKSNIEAVKNALHNLTLKLNNDASLSGKI